MSIIEKAIEKAEKKRKVRRERAAVGARVEETEPSTSKPLTNTPPAAHQPREAPASPPVDAPLLSPESAVKDAQQADKDRSAIPGRTLKQVELDFERLDAGGIITPKTRRGALVEQFRIIKRPMIMKAAKESASRVPNGNLILVTSAVPGEGKTFTAVNLAMSIAMELDHTVLLVDADPANSDVSHVLGIDVSEGLMDYLVEPSRTLSELLVKTDMAKLTVLPSGHPRGNITELLASDDMRRFIDELARRYSDRIVILDSPPLLAASGASVLAHLAGQTLMVVEAIRTPQSALREALALLKPIHNVGLVLNKSRESFGPGYQYGQYQAYGSDIR